MSIELELRLEGQDANEETLLDLMDWLGRADIDGLTIKRKELPSVEGDMSYMFDLLSIVITLVVGIPPAYLAAKELRRSSKEQKAQEPQKVEQLADTILDWQEDRYQNISVSAQLKNSGSEEYIKKQIQSVLKYMETKSRKGK